MDLTIDGEHVYAATGGRPFDPAKPALFFLHGAGMDHSVWVLQTRYFAHRGFSVIAPDLPGHGRSGGEALSSIDAMADWVIRLMDGLGLGKASLVGHSMGSLLSFDCAARHSDTIERLALLGAALKMPVHPDLLAAATANEHRAFGLICDWGHGPTGHYGGNRAPGLWLMGGGIRLLEKIPPGVLSKDLEACNAYLETFDHGPRITANTLVLSGSQDKMTPAKAGAKLAGLIEGAEFCSLAGAGHMMMLEQPDETLDTLRNFLMA